MFVRTCLSDVDGSVLKQLMIFVMSLFICMVIAFY